MLRSNLKIIRELKDFLCLITQNPELVSIFSTVPNGFTRKRKLYFDRLVLLIAKLCKKTLDVEIESFFDDMQLQVHCSVSAFSQQRVKLSPMFYTVWNSLLCASFYCYNRAEIKRWNGYRLIAGDGSNVSLVCNPALETYFGGQSNQQGSFVQGKAFYFYDVLNQITLESNLQPYRVGELNMAYAMINGNLQEDMLMIYDRNFCSYKMVALHQFHEKEIKFIIRAKETQNIIKAFLNSGAKSSIINLSPTPSAIEGLAKSGYKIDKTQLLKVRLVRVNLESTVEVLMTNLFEEEGFHYDDFKELYFKRWGIETNISFQKNILQLEAFSGLNPVAVMQDFYATVFISNLFAILTRDAQQIIDNKDKTTKYPRKINGNKSFARLRTHLIPLFINSHPETILKTLNMLFIRAPLPVRKNRKFERKVKNKQSKSKHKTFMNYKPAF
jgi:hypothetical protein